jgi:hypothetical protein
MSCCLKLENLKRLIFLNKNWPNYPRIDCKPPFNVVELIEKDLEEFEGSLKQDELLNI